jgi:nucleotidyltransferase substrate binding protein (TIGR01987 family)
MKDYLLAEGVALDQLAPKSVIREAFAFNLITDGDGWMLALNDRNAMSYTYNEQTFEKIFQAIQQTYFGLLTALYDGLRVQR